MSRARMSLSVMAVLAVSVAAGSAVMAGSPPIRLTEKEPASTTNIMRYPTVPVGIGGRIFQGYCMYGPFGRHGFATWQVPSGYYVLEAYCGVDDRLDGENGTIEFLLDGDTAKSVEVSGGQKAARVSIPVRGGQSLRINIDRAGVVAEPRFLSEPTDSSPVEVRIPNATSSSSSNGNCYTISVDPRSLKEIATSIAAKVQADPVGSNNVLAVADFATIPVDESKQLCGTVARNVREDLSTAMGDVRSFRLVERGQLGKAIESLKLDQTGAIDSETAKKLGKLVSADYILIGSISDRGTFTVINARMIEVQTGEIKYSASVEMRR